MSKNDEKMMSRRALLRSIGLVAGAAYVAPAVVGVEVAEAATGGAERSWRPTRPTRPFRPTRPTRPFRPTRPTRPFRPTRPTRPWRR